MSFSTRDLSIISSSKISAANLSEAYRALTSDIRIIGDRVLINTDFGQIAIDPNPYAESEYDPHILEKIRETISNPIFYILRYSTNRAAEEAILCWPSTDGTLVDNNLGTIEPLSIAIRKIGGGINWIDMEA